MSSTSESVQYNIEISIDQPNTGAQYYVQASPQQTSTFGDTEAVAMLNALIATVPADWGTPIAQLSKLDQSMTQWNWSASAGAFQ